MTNDQRKLVLVVDTDQRFVDDLRPQLTSHRVLSARDLDEAREIVLGGRVDLALLGPAFASDVAIGSAQTLLAADPSLEIALAADVVTNRLLKAALRGGFVDVLDTPVSARDLDDVMRQVASRAPSEMSFEVEPMTPDPPSAQQLPATGSPGRAPVSVPIQPTPAYSPLAETPPAPAHQTYPPPVPAAETAGDSFSTAAEVSFTSTPAQPPAPVAAPPVQFEVAPRFEPSVAQEAPRIDAPAAEVSPSPEAAATSVPAAPEATRPPVESAPRWPVESAVPAAPVVEPGPVAATPAPPVAPHPPAVAPDEAPPVSKTAVLDQVLPPPPATPPPMPSPPSTPFVPQAATPRPTVFRSGPGKVIAVMAGKGGSGKTVTATNLAIAIGMRSDPERVAIVDADLQFGDVALLLQLDPIRTLDDVVGQVDTMSDERLDGALLRHESGIRVLPAPLLPVHGGEISAKSVVEVVDRLRSLYDTIVVDTGPVFDDGLITMLEHADQVIAVVDMDLPSVKNAKVALDGLRQIGFDMDRIRLVVNRANSKARLDLVELERSLGLRVGGSIPSDRLVPQSVNEGIPVLALSPRSKVARAFHALAESLDVSADRERITSR